MIEYTIDAKVNIEEFRDLLISSTLGKRRPVDEPIRLQAMLDHGNLIVTARSNGKLVGIARSLTDFLYCTYLSDLAVDQSYQHQGIGKELIRQTKMATPKASLTLLAAPEAIPYYPKIGMHQYEYCFRLLDVAELH